MQKKECLNWIDVAQSIDVARSIDVQSLVMWQTRFEVLQHKYFLFI
jgi:hypothetical protein